MHRSQWETRFPVPRDACVGSLQGRAGVGGGVAGTGEGRAQAQAPSYTMTLRGTMGAGMSLE